MTSTAPEMPPDVLQALVNLEAATDPTDLGPPYRTLLQWRKRSRSWGSRSLFAFAWFIVSIAAAVAVVTRPEIPEFWRGALSTAIVIGCLEKIHSLLAPPPTLVTRVENVLDRWRHLVPAMREKP